MSSNKKYGYLAGIIPYDLRKPTWSRIKSTMWNSLDDRILVPRVYGAGWTINLYQLRKKHRLLFFVLTIGVIAGATLEVFRFLTTVDQPRDDV